MICHSKYAFEFLSETGIRLSGPRELHGREGRKHLRAGGYREASLKMLTTGQRMAVTQTSTRGSCGYLHRAEPIDIPA